MISKERSLLSILRLVFCHSLLFLLSLFARAYITVSPSSLRKIRCLCIVSLNDKRKKEQIRGRGNSTSASSIKSEWSGRLGRATKNVTMDGHASLIRITERAKRCPIDPIRVFLDQSPLRRLSAYFLHFTCSLVLDRFISIASSLIPYLDIHSVTSDDYSDLSIYLPRFDTR